MRRLKNAPALVGTAGFALLLLGTAIIVSVGAQTSASALAASGPYELYCPGTPVGNVVLNDATTSGTLSPAAPTSGQQFSLTGYQTVVNLPASLASAAGAIQPNLEGSATAQVDATGATPATTSVGPLDFNVPIPSPVPTNGVGLSLPSTPQTVGPFTATSSDIAIQEDPSASLSLTISGSPLALTCTAYPNDSVTPSGITTTAPTASPIAPVIAASGSPTTTSIGTTTTTGVTCPGAPTTIPCATTTTTTGATTTTSSTPTSTTTSTPGTPTTLTGAYELYCPGTPVGNVVLNDAMTSATLSPAAPTAGQSFSLTGYQTMVNIPNSLASAAASLQPNLEGSATAQIDATGATPATTPEGPLNFNVPIPSPVPTDGVALSLPSTAATVSGFTATSAQITIQEDSAASLTLTVSGAPLSLTCTAYPNDTVTPSGITTSTPSASPIAPVIAVAGGGSTSTTATAPPATTSTTAPGITTTTGLTTSTTVPLTPPTTTAEVAPAPTTTVPAATVTSASTTTIASTSTTTASANLCGAPANPYNYSYCSNSGTMIYSPPSNVCSYFQCIDNFFNSTGYMVECQDGTVSMAGGFSDACTDHGGVELTVYETTTSATSSTTAPTSTASTQPPSTSGTSGTTSPSSRAVTASSSALAFTGSGPGLKTMTLVGSAVILLGILMLVLADIPGRTLRQLAYLSPERWKHRASADNTRIMVMAVGRAVARRIGWLLGR